MNVDKNRVYKEKKKDSTPSDLIRELLWTIVK